jgi:hypothetical protein
MMRLFDQPVLMTAELPITPGVRTAIANCIGSVKLKNDRSVEGDV